MILLFNYREWVYRPYEWFWIVNCFPTTFNFIEIYKAGEYDIAYLWKHRFSLEKTRKTSILPPKPGSLNVPFTVCRPNSYGTNDTAIQWESWLFRPKSLLYCACQLLMAYAIAIKINMTLSVWGVFSVHTAGCLRSPNVGLPCAVVTEKIKYEA